MRIEEYLGNEAAVNRLRTALQGGGLSHALLFTAPDGCGRGFLARCVAADALYPGGGPGADAVMEQRSGEFLVVRGEGRSGGIPVDSIRRVRAEVYHSALSAEGRAVWICDAHRMAAPAANALLKVLEEPPAGVLFLLTTRDASALPVTVQSRCTHIPLNAAGVAVCRQVLEGAAARLEAPPEPFWPARLAQLYAGRIGSGLKALRDEGRLAVVRDALAAASAAANGNVYELMRVFSGYEGRADGERDRRDALLSDMTDALESAFTGGVEGLPAISPAAAAALLPPLADARVALTRNAAPKLAFTALALNLVPGLSA